MPSTVIVVGRKYQVNLQSSIQKNLASLSHLSGPICGLQPPPALPPNPKERRIMFDVIIALGVVIVVAFIFSPAR